MPNVSTVILILSLAVLAILVLSTLFGFLAGLKREIRLVVLFVVLLLVVWLLLGNSSTKILDEVLSSANQASIKNMLGISANFETLRQALIEFLKYNFSDMKELLVEGTKTYAFVNSMLDFAVKAVILIAGTVVVYVLYLVIRLLSFIIGGIIRLCTRKRRQRKLDKKQAKMDEEGIGDSVVAVKSDAYDGEVVITVSENPKKVYRGKRRPWGALLGFLRGVFVCILLLTPIVGILSIVREVEPETVNMVVDMMGSDSKKTAANSDSEMANWLMDLSEAFENSAVNKVFKTPEYFFGKRLEDVFFDDLFTLKTETQTINLREDIITLIKVANILPPAYVKDADIPINIWLLDDVKQDELFDLLKQVKLLSELMPVGIEYAGTIPDFKELLNKSGQTLDGLINVDWKKDLPIILDAVREALELGNLFEDFDPLQMESEVLRKVCENLGSTEFITELMPVLINCALYTSVVEQFVGPWNNGEIKTNQITWKDELLRLVDVYEKVQQMGLDFNDINIDAILGNDSETALLEEALKTLVAGKLFLDVLVPIADVAKEYQAGQLDYNQFKGLIKLANLNSEDWQNDISLLVEMGKALQQMNVFNDQDIDLEDVDSIRTLVENFFDLMILSEKVNATEVMVGDKKLELKTLLVEAALNKFNVFDIDGSEFTQFTDAERARINWEHEKEVFIGLVDEYERFIELAHEHEQTVMEAFKDFVSYLDYDETYDILVDALSKAVDSEVALAIIPLAIDKFIVPIIDNFEEQAGYTDQHVSEGFSDKLRDSALKEEIINLIYIVLDAKQLEINKLLHEGTLNDVAFGAYLWMPREDTSAYELYQQVSEAIGYSPARDELAINDIINRIFKSAVLEGRQGKAIRIITAVYLGVRLTLDDVESIDYSEAERLTIVNAISELKPTLTDPDFRILNEQGQIDLEYLLTSEHAQQALNGLSKLMDSELVAILLPEIYHQMILPKGIIPTEIAELVSIQSNWLGIEEGLTGKELTHDVKIVLQIAEIAVQDGVIDYLRDPSEDLYFDGLNNDVAKVFDLFKDLNLLKMQPEKLMVYILGKLGVEVTEDELQELDANWPDEIEVLKQVTLKLLDVLHNSELYTVNQVKDVIKDIQNGDRERVKDILISENIALIGDIFTELSNSKLVALAALPLINKYLVPMLGVEEITEEQYSIEMVQEDLRKIGDLVRHFADKDIVDLTTNLLQRYTSLISGEAEDMPIPYDKSDAIKQVLVDAVGLNLVNTPQIKQLIIDKLAGVLGSDLSYIDVNEINLVSDAEAIGNAIQKVLDAFEKTERLVTVEEVINTINKLVKESTLSRELIDNENLRLELLDLVDAVDILLDTTIVNALKDELKTKVLDALKSVVTIYDVEYSGDDLLDDASTLLDIVRKVLDEEFFEFAKNTLEYLNTPLHKDDVEPMEIPFDSPVFKEIITDTLSLALVNTDSMKQFVLDKLAGVIPQLKDADATEIDFRADSEKLGEAVSKLLQAVGKLDIVDTIADGKEALDKVKDGKVKELINEALEAEEVREALLDVLDAFDLIVDTTLVQAIDDELVEFLRQMISSLFELSEEEYNGEALVEDVHGVLDILRSLLNDEKVFDYTINTLQYLKVLSDKEVEAAEIPYDSIANTIKSIIEKATALNLVNTVSFKQFMLDKLAAIAEEIKDAEPNEIDLRADGEKLGEAIALIIDGVSQLNKFFTLEDIADAVNNIKDPALLKQLIDNLGLRNLLLNVLDAVDLLADTTLVNAASDGFATFATKTLAGILNGMFGTSGADALRIEEYAGIELIEDVHTLTSALRDLLGEEIYDAEIDLLHRTVEMFKVTYIDDAEVPYELVSHVSDFVEKIFSLNLLNNLSFKQYLVERLGSFGLDASLVNAAEINFEADGVLVGEALELLAEALDTTGILNTYLDLKDFVKDILRNENGIAINQELITSENTPEVINLIVDALEKLLDTTTVHALGDALENLLEKVVPSQFVYLFDSAIYGEELIEDAHSLLEVVRAVGNAELYKIPFNYDVDLETAEEALINITELLFHTHIVNNNPAYVLANTLALFLQFNVTEEDYASVDFEAEYDLIQDIIRDLFVLLKNVGVQSINGAKDLFNEIKGQENLPQYLLDSREILNNDNLHAVLDILEKVLSSGILEHTYDEIYGRYLESMLGQFGALNEILDLSEYTYDLLKEDVLGITGALHQIVDWDALGIYRDDQYMDFNKTEPFTSLVSAILGSHFLEMKLPAIYDYVCDYLIDLSDIDVNDINLRADADIINQAIEIIMKEVLASDDFPVHFMNDIQYIDVKHLEKYITIDALNSVLDALYVLKDTTILKEGLYWAYNNMLFDLVPEQFHFAIAEGLNKEQLVTDYGLIIEALRVAVNSGIHEDIIKGRIHIEGLAELIKGVLSKLLETSLLGSNLPQTAKGLLELLNIEVDDEIVEAVDYPHDFEIIYEILAKVEEMLLASEFVYVDEVVGVVREIKSFNDLLHNEQLINDHNLHRLVDILDIAVDLSLVAKLFKPLSEQFLEKVTVPEMFEGFLDLSDYPGELFVEDAHKLIPTLHALVDFNILGIVRDDDKIEWENTRPIENIIKAFFETYYIENKLPEIFNLIDKYIPLNKANINGVFLDQDSEQFAAAYAVIAKEILAGELFPDYFSHLKVFDLYLKEFLNVESLLTLVKAAREVVDTTLVYEISLDVLDFVNENYVPEDFKFVIEDANLSKELAREDIGTLLDIAQIAIEGEVYPVFFGEDLDLNKPETWKQIVSKVFDLHLLESEDIRMRLVNQAVTKANVEEMEEPVDWDQEEMALHHIIDAACALLVKYDLNMLSKLTDLINSGEYKERSFLTDEFALDAVDLVDAALESGIVRYILASLYEKAVNEYIPYESAKQVMLFCEGERDYNRALFNEDCDKLAEILRTAIEGGALEYLFGETKELPQTIYVNNLIDQLYELNLIHDRADLFIQPIFNKFDIEGDLSNIDWDNEVAVLKDTITALRPVLVNNGYDTIDSIIDLAKEFDYHDLTKALVLELLDVAEIAVESEVVQIVAAHYYNWAVEKYVPYESAKAVLRFGEGDRDYNSELFGNDLPRFIDLARLALEYDAHHIITQKDWLLPSAEVLNEMLDKLFELDLINNREDLFAIPVFNKLGIEYDFSEVDWDHEENVLKNVVVAARNVLEKHDLNTVKEILDVVQSGEYKERDFLTDELAYDAVDVVEAALDSKVLQQLLAGLYEKAVNQYIPYESAKQVMLFGEGERDYNKELFNEDLTKVANILRTAIEAGALEYLFGETDDLPQAIYVNNLIDQLYELNLIHDRADLFVQALFNKLGVEGDLSDIDWDEEVEVAKDTVIILRRTLVELGYDTISKVIDLASDLNEDLITEENIRSVLDVAEVAVDSMVIKMLAAHYYNWAVNKFVGDEELRDILLIAEEEANVNPRKGHGRLADPSRSYTREGFYQDAKGMIEIARCLLDAGLFTLYTDKDMNFENEEILASAIDMIYELQLVHNRLDLFVQYLFNKFNIEGELTDIDWDNEVAVWKEFMLSAFGVLREYEYEKLSKVIDATKGEEFEVSKEMVVSALDLLEIGIQSTVIKLVVAHFYDSLIRDNVKVEGLADLIAFGDGERDYNRDLFLEDAEDYVRALRLALELGAYELYRDHDLEIPASEDINELIDLVYGLNLVHNRLDLILEWAFARFDLEVELQGQDIDWDNEVATLEKVIEKLLPILEKEDLHLISDVISYIKETKYTSREFLSDEMVLDLTDVLEVLLESKTARNVLAALYPKLVQKIEDEKLRAFLEYGEEEKDYNKELLMEDLDKLPEIIRTAVNGNGLAYLFGETKELPQTIYLNNLIDQLYELNLLNGRLQELVQWAFDKYEIEGNLDIVDWDNEIVAIKDLLPVLRNALVKNGYTDFDIIADKFSSQNFDINEQIISDVLDVLEVGSDSLVLSYVLAHFYDKAIKENIQNEKFIRAFAFGVEFDSYNRYLFVSDIKDIVQVARYALDLGFYGLYSERNMTIPTAEEINELIDMINALGLVNGRLYLFFDLIFDKLEVEVNIEGIDWDNEVEVAKQVVSILVPRLAASDIYTAQELKSVLVKFKNDPVNFAKNNRQYVNLTNAYALLDALEALGNSELFMRAVLPLYVKVEEYLPEIITKHFHMSLYTEEMLRADYQSWITIARDFLQSGIYHIYSQRRSYVFSDEAIEYLQEIVALGCELQFTELFTPSYFEFLFDVANLGEVPADVYLIMLDYDEESLVSAVRPAAEIWNRTEGLRLEIPLLADRELFENLEELLSLLGETTVLEALFPWAYAKYVQPRVERFNQYKNYVDFSKLGNMPSDDMMNLYRDMVRALQLALEIGVFGTEGIDFDHQEQFEELYEIAERYVVFHNKLEKLYDKYINRIDLMGVIVLPYAEVLSTREELKAYKAILKEAMDFADKHLRGFSTSDLTRFAEEAFENDVMSLLTTIGESQLLNASFIDLVNGAARVIVGREFAEYTAIHADGYTEFKAQVSELFDIIEKLDVLGVLNRDIKYKDTITASELIDLVEVSPFIAGQENILIKIALKAMKKNVSLDLSHVVWANEYAYLRAFLADAYYPLNSEGFDINFDDPMSLLDHTDAIEELVEALRNLQDSQLLVEVFTRAVDKVTAKAGYKGLLNYSHLDKSDYNTYKDIVKAEYLALLDLVKYAAESHILNGDSFNVPATIQFLDTAIALEGVRYNKAKLFDTVIDKLPTFADAELVIPADIDYDAELQAIRGILVAIELFADQEGNIAMDEIQDLISKSTNVAGLEQLFTALNNSVVYRQQLFSAVDEKISAMDNGDFKASELVSDWFKDQKQNGMLPIEDWAQEVIYLARLVAIVNNVNNTTGFGSFADIELGIMNDTNAAEVATQEFDVQNYGLRQLLQIMAEGQTCDLAKLNGVLDQALVDRTADGSGQGAIKTVKKLVELTNEEWADDIDDFINLLQLSQSFGLISGSDSMSDKLQDLTADEIKAYILAFNRVDALRELLPDLVSDAIDNVSASQYKSGWLIEQCGLDAQGNNNPMASVEEWDHEAEQLAVLVSKASNLDLDNMNLSTLTDEQIDALAVVLVAMNEAYSLDINVIVNNSNDLLEEKGYQTRSLGVGDRNNNGTNKDEWSVEIPRLIEIIKVLRNVSDLNVNIIKTEGAEMGAILDQMKLSYVFGNDTLGDGDASLADDTFNSLMLEVLNECGLIKDPLNANGFIELADAEATDWTVYNYTSELALLGEYDTEKEATEQDDDVIKILSGSQIVRDFYDIASVINEKVAGEQVTLYGEIIILADYVNGGTPLTNDDLAGKDWIQEIDDINAIKVAFDEAESDSTAFKADIDALANTSNGTLASDAAEDIRESLMTSGVWDYL